MSAPTERLREGSLEAPTRHPLDWRNPDFYNEQSLNQELERVFDICHGCRRCVNLCNAFPTLFGLIDESSTMEIDGVDNKDYVKVVDQCYLCDLCYMTKCPYVPPHEWNVDFPHLMLRAKAIKFKQGNTRFRDRLLTSTDKVGRLASIPVVVQAVNTANKCSAVRKVLDKVLGVHPDAILPEYHSDTLRRRMKRRGSPRTMVEPTSRTRGRVVLFTTCYGNYNEPHIGEDLAKVFELNGIEVTIPGQEQCCGMPKLEVGDLEAAQRKLIGEESGGVLVLKVQPGSSADTAGLMKGDIILEINKKQVTDAESFRKQLDGAKTGQILLLYVFHSHRFTLLSLSVP